MEGVSGWVLAHSSVGICASAFVRQYSCVSMGATMGREGQAILDDLLAHPGDAGLMRIYADWLIDHDEMVLAFAYQWAAARRRWPYTSPSSRLYYWKTRRGGEMERPWQLDVGVLAFFWTRRKQRSVADCFVRLAEALARMQQVLRV